MGHGRKWLFPVLCFFVLVFFLFRNIIVKSAITFFLHPAGASIIVGQVYLGVNSLILKNVRLLDPDKVQFAEVERVELYWNNHVKLVKPKIVFAPKTAQEWNISFLLQHYRYPITLPERLVVALQDGEIVLEDMKWKGNKNTPIVQRVRKIQGSFIAQSHRRGELLLSGKPLSGGTITIKGPVFTSPVSGNINITGENISLLEWGNYVLAPDYGTIKEKDRFKILEGRADLNITAVLSSNSIDNNTVLDLEGNIYIKDGILKVPAISAPFYSIGGTIFVARDIIRFLNMRGRVGATRATMDGSIYNNPVQFAINLKFPNLYAKELLLFEPFISYKGLNVSGQGEGSINIAGSSVRPFFTGLFTFPSIMLLSKGATGNGKMAFSFFDNTLFLHDFNFSSSQAKFSTQGVTSFLPAGHSNVAMAGNVEGLTDQVISLSKVLKYPIPSLKAFPERVKANGIVLGSLGDPSGSFKVHLRDGSVKSDLALLMGNNSLFANGTIKSLGSNPIGIAGYLKYRPDLAYHLALTGERVNLPVFVNKGAFSVYEAAPGNLEAGIFGNNKAVLLNGNLSGKDGSKFSIVGGLKEESGKWDVAGLFVDGSKWPVTLKLSSVNANPVPFNMRGLLSGSSYFQKDKQTGAWKLDKGNVRAKVSFNGSGTEDFLSTITSSNNINISFINNKKSSNVLALNLPGAFVAILPPTVVKMAPEVYKSSFSLAGRIGKSKDLPIYSGSLLSSYLSAGDPIGVSGELSLFKDHLILDSIVLRASRGSAMFSGILSYAPSNPIAMTVVSDRFPLSVLKGGHWGAALDKAAFMGQLSGSLSLGGTLLKPIVEGIATTRHGAWFGQPFESIFGRFKYKNDLLILPQFVIRYRDSVVSGGGYYSAKQGIKFAGIAPSLELADISLFAKYLQPIVGKGTASWQLKGMLASPYGELDLDFNNILVHGVPIGNIKGKFALDKGKLYMNSVTLKEKDGSVTLSGQLSLPVTDAGISLANLDLKGEIDKISIGTLLKWTKQTFPIKADGTVKGTFALAGPANALKGYIKTILEKGVIQGIPIDTAQLYLLMEKDNFTIKNISLQSGPARLNGSGSFTENNVKNIVLDVQNLDLAWLERFYHKAKNIRGNADLHLKLEGGGKSLQGLAALEVRDGGTHKYSIDRLRALVAIKEGEAHITDLRLVKSGYKAQITGVLPFDLSGYKIVPKGPMDLIVRVEKEPVSFLSFIFPSITKADGNISAEISLRGEPALPVADGQIVLEQGALQLKGVDTPLTDLSALVLFQPHGNHTVRGEGKIGGGKLSFSGSGMLKQFKLGELDANLTLSKAKIVSPLVNGTVNAALTLRKIEADSELGGNISLEESALGFPFKFTKPFTKFPLNLDLALKIGNKVSLRHPFVSLKLLPGQLQVKGTFADPYIEGELLTRQGNIYFLSNNFRITRGRALFEKDRGLVPVLEAEATSTRRVDSTTVSLRIAGVPDQLNVELSSQPELPTKDIISILTGERDLQRLARGRELNKYLGEEAVNLVTQAVRSQVLYGVEEAFANTFSLDLFALEFLPTGQFGLKVGKEFARNFFLTYSHSFTSGRKIGVQDPQSLWGVEYLFNPHTSLWLTIDNNGEYNTSVRTRWRF